MGALNSHQMSLHELLQELSLLEQKSKSPKRTKTLNITSCLKGLIAFVDRYAPAIDCLVQTCSGSVINPATLVWGLIRIVLEVWPIC